MVLYTRVWPFLFNHFSFSTAQTDSQSFDQLNYTMDDWRKWKPTNTPGAEEAEKKALEACQAALEAEKHANAAQKAAQEGKVELAQQEDQAAKELATKAQKRAEAAEKASIAHANPATPKPDLNKDDK